MGTTKSKTKKASRIGSQTEGPVSKIQITFEGMMILMVKDGGPYCDVGILKHAPNHAANILITKIPESGAPETMLHLHGDEFESRMWLDVEKFEAGITLYKDESQRFRRATDHGNPIDFRWALDFEGDEMYNFKVPVDPTSFKSILRINDGTFYTQEKSQNRIVRKSWRLPNATLGKVAVRLRAETELNEQSAYFQNGLNVKPLELKAEDGVNYGIYVSQVRHQHTAENGHSTSDEIDAENYNFAIAVDRPYNQKIHFDREERATPDSVCLVPTMSQTDLSII